MVSIKSFTQETKKASKEPEVEDLSKKPREEFSQQQFDTVWKNYISQLKETGKSSFASTLEVSAPKLHELTITLEIENTVQENELNAEKAHLIGYLRGKLNNYSIKLDYNKVDVKQEKRYYTNSERFNRLAEINPTLNKLKSRFNLETDF